MTLATASNKVIASGNGLTTAFAFTFPFSPLTTTSLQIIFTDALGNQTIVGSSNYTLVLNPPAAGQIWGLGGTVTYPTVASGLPPIALGTSLTIARIVADVQSTSITNQSNVYPQVTEQALDYEMMAVQQLAEEASRTLQFPIVDPAPNGTLPAAAQRANLALLFDASGNPIVGAIPGIPVSSAMAPVFQAVSIAAGRAALGSGTVGDAIFLAATAAAAVAALGILGLANTFTVPQTLKSTTAGAAVETIFTLLRNKGAGAANDFGEALAFDGMNAATVQKSFAQLFAQIVTATAGAEDGQLLFATVLAGALAARMTLKSGLQIGAPTGGDKGAGTLNATGLFVNGTVLPLTKTFTGANVALTTPGLGGVVTQAHGFGSVPALAWFELINTTPEGNWSANDVVPNFPAMQTSDAGTVNRSIGVSWDTTNVFLRVGANGLQIFNKTSGAPLAMTLANWSIRARALA